LGYICEHGLLEVPADYGDQLAFYAPIDAQAALEHLAKFHRRPLMPSHKFD
jgi:hypothetical protein